MAVVVTVAKGYDLGYIWKTQGEAAAARTMGAYYINAAQAGEPPGRWWGPGAQALGFTPGQVVQRASHEAVYQQIDPRSGAGLGRAAAGTRPSLIIWPGCKGTVRDRPVVRVISADVFEVAGVCLVQFIGVAARVAASRLS